MDSEEQRQEEHAVRQILSEDLGETSRRKRDIVPPLSTRSQQNESSFEYSETFHDYNINICVDIIETDYQKVENEHADSIVEIEGAKVFPFSSCSKICQSKGGLTKHTNSKHGEPDNVSSSRNTTPLCFDTIKRIVDTIKRSIGKRGHGRRTNDGKDGQRRKRRTNDGKDGQTMEKTDKRWKRRTNDGKDGQTMEKTDKRWKRRTNDGKDGQTMEKTDKRWKRWTNNGKDGRVFSYI